MPTIPIGALPPDGVALKALPNMVTGFCAFTPTSNAAATPVFMPPMSVELNPGGLFLMSSALGG